MNVKEKMEEFNKRWNISSNDSYEDSLKKFKNRILNVLEYVDFYIDQTEFCNYCGIKEKALNRDHVYTALYNEKNEIEFYKLIELSLLLINDPTFKKAKIKEISNAIDLSDINLTIAISKNEVILYPKGEKELDKKLVNEILVFLNQQSNNHFIDALKFYQTKKYIKSSESLRRSVEEFLRFKLKNKKGLKENIKELQKGVKKNNKSSQIRAIILQIFGYLDTFFNENSKHNDGEIDEEENEFIIYQTGTLLRYINKVIN
jgi:hypothetical protein